jgi:prepilin-type N-terminal cleavage/methylation domain-containing protein
MNNKSFTLIELLVVIAIIGLLASMILVSMKGTTGKAKITKGLRFSQSINHALGAYAVGIWNFNDNDTPNTANDRSGYGNHGTITGATYTSDTPLSVVGSGEGKYALSFNGVNDYVRAPANFHFQTIHGPSTLELWFNPSSLSGSKKIFSDNCYEWGIYHSGSTIYGTAYWSVSGGTVSTGNWYHAVVVHEHPAGLTNTKIKFYINGDLKGETTGTITTHNGYTDSPYWIGADECYADNNFHGSIDEVRIYEQALTLGQIQQRYAESAPAHGIVLNLK